jgi:hypothetical protein
MKTVFPDAKKESEFISFRQFWVLLLPKVPERARLFSIILLNIKIFPALAEPSLPLPEYSPLHQSQ